MVEVVIYTKANCPYCHHARRLLEEKNINFKEIPVDEDPEQLQKMIDVSGQKTLPQIIIDGKPIGGFTDLWELELSGKLNELLKGEK